ncbi:hypothetical protein [Flavobacterium sp. FlaQc-50]|jgi:hypothetical protein|uniref:hypothetical protein n=1 Tax=unclassified Flavobacterium TaxID=196869 RepID=UPI003757EE8A
MSIKFNQENFFVDKFSLSAKRNKDRSADIPKSDELSGIELRLSRVLIKDNGTAKIFPFPGLAQMYLLIIVISDLDNPIQNFDLKGFHKVDDMEELPVDRTIFYWKQTDNSKINPGQIHAFVSVVKSKENLREVGGILAKVKEDKDYSNLVSGLKVILSGSTPFGQVADSLFNLASIVGKYLGNVKDKPLLTWVQSFTDINGDLDSLGKAVKEKENDNAALAMTLIVRDKSREKKILQNQPEEIKENLKLDIH